MKKGPAFIGQEKKRYDEDNTDTGNNFDSRELVFEQAEDNTGILAADYLEKPGIEKALTPFQTAPYPRLGQLVGQQE